MPPKKQSPSGKDEYHHFVPRFILRKFMSKEIEISPAPQLQRKQQKRNQRGPKVQELVQCYSIPSGILTETPISTSFGVKNLYKDLNNQKDAFRIEKKLSVLEGQASRSIADLLKIVESKANISAAPVFRVKRKYLNHLRKFLFIMPYRKSGFKKTYFQEDHPENSGAAEWIRSYREKNDLGPDPSEVWLHVLEYHLDTPHSEIIAQGKLATEKMGEGSRSSLALDPKLENYEAVAYYGEAHNMFLSIWEAAEGEEFIITDNSFGLVEAIRSDLLRRDMPLILHKFFVISPKIALVLCSTFLHPQNYDPRIEQALKISNFWGAPHKSANITGSDGSPVCRMLEDKEPWTFEEDWMEFEILKLSAHYTHEVNAIILANIKDTAEVAFNSKTAVLRTLEAFALNRDYNNQALYEPLVKQLLKETGGASSFAVHPNPFPTSAKISAMMPNSDTKAPRATAPQPSSTLAGLYEVTYQAYLKFQESTVPGIERYKHLEGMILQNSAEMIIQHPGDLKPRPASLVKTMPNENAIPLFRFTEGMFRKYGVVGKVIFHEIVSIAFLGWLLKNRRSAFESLEQEMHISLKEYDD